MVTGKTCIVTGANSGVGFEATRLLAQSGWGVVLVCRDRGRGEEAIVRIRDRAPSAELRLQVTDLGSLAQVRDLGAELSEDLPSIDLLVNNAGVFRSSLERTEDGFERTMGVNHLAHFLLTHLLLPRLMESGGRVINVSSEAHRRARLSHESLEKTFLGENPYNGMMAYSNSKLANILFTAELARRYRVEELSTCAMHPGVLATRIWNQNRNLLSLFMVLLKPLMGRPSVGGDAVALLSRLPGPAVHGRYFNKRREARPMDPAQDAGLAGSLWNLSLGMTGLE